MRPADRAWLTLAVGVGAYDLCCAPGETLSEGADRYPRWLVVPGATLIAAHVANLIPARLDPIHLLFAAVCALRNIITIRRTVHG